MAEKARRVLVVEDEGLVALALEEALTAVGYYVVGPAPTTKKALKLIANEEIDVALLDVNLGNERIDPVARALADASIPFVFSTGYSTGSALPPGFEDRKTLCKPFRPEELLDAIGRVVGSP